MWVLSSLCAGASRVSAAASAGGTRELPRPRRRPVPRGRVHLRLAALAGARAPRGLGAGPTRGCVCVCVEGGLGAGGAVGPVVGRSSGIHLCCACIAAGLCTCRLARLSIILHAWGVSGGSSL